MSTINIKAGLTSSHVKESLVESASYFDKGEYKKALDMLSGVDIQGDFDNSDDMKLAFKIRAIAYEQTKDMTRASEAIRALFFLDPNYKFDPFDTPASVIALAQEEKNNIDKKSTYLSSIKNNIKPKPNIEQKPPMLTTLFPLGLNHFHLGSPVKGGIYLSLQGLGLALNVTAYWWKQSYLESFGASRLKNHNYQRSFETAQLMQYISLGATIISYCVSVIDALIHIQSTRS
jgi:hypothetical protein